MSHVVEIESVLFKPIAGGYVFQAPNPWLFGASKRYLVNGNQKDQLLALIASPRPVLRTVVIIVGVLVWTAIASTIVWAVSPHEDPTSIDAIAIGVLVVVPMVLALIFTLQRRMRRLQPLLVGLPRTNERITRGELKQSMVNAMSMKRLVVIGSIWAVASLMQVFTLVIRNPMHPLFSDAQSFMATFVAIVAAALAGGYLLAAWRKRQQKVAA